MSEPNHSGIPDNAAGAVAYITLVPAIVFLALAPYSKSSFVRFHAWQSIFLSLVAIAVSFVLSIILPFSLMFGAFLFTVFTWTVWILWILLWIICGVQALNGKRFKLPIIGALAEKQAGV